MTSSPAEASTCLIFDIDGTLVSSTEFDDRLYRMAILEVLGDVQLRSVLTDYEHVSDAGILRAICRENNIDSAVVEPRIRNRFGELVSMHLTTEACAAIPGALSLWNSLCGDQRFAVGLATGGWSHTARMKLVAAGYPIDGIAFASSDDSHERTQIMQRCRAMLPPTTSTVYIGDGEWDLAAAESLGWRFIGVGNRLRGKCASWMADFASLDTIERLQGF
jgi:beta-phosphoglucomutase-like phosphatase (HAD superfamily)